MSFDDNRLTHEGNKYLLTTFVPHGSKTPQEVVVVKLNNGGGICRFNTSEVFTDDTNGADELVDNGGSGCV
jgi:hypothetical protein